MEGRRTPQRRRENDSEGDERCAGGRAGVGQGWVGGGRRRVEAGRVRAALPRRRRIERRFRAEVFENKKSNKFLN